MAEFKENETWHVFLRLGISIRLFGSGTARSDAWRYFLALWRCRADHGPLKLRTKHGGDNSRSL
jgi:hypothetical protein